MLRKKYNEKIYNFISLLFSNCDNNYKNILTGMHKSTQLQHCTHQCPVTVVILFIYPTCETCFIVRRSGWCRVAVVHNVVPIDYSHIMAISSVMLLSPDNCSLLVLRGVTHCGRHHSSCSICDPSL